MISWQTTAVLCALFAALGVVADKLTLSRHKRRLHDRLSGWWIQLDDLPIPELPSTLATRALTVLEKPLNLNKSWWRRLIRLVLLSFLLGFLAYCVYSVYLIRMRSAEGRFSFPADVLSYTIFLSVQYVIMAVVNVLFDLATILITLKIVRVISTARAHAVILLVLCDFFLAYLIFSSAMLVMYMIGDSSFSLDAFLHLPRISWSIASGTIIWVFTGNPTGPDELLLAGLMGMAIFVPTFMFLSLLLFLSIAKSIVTVAKGVFSYLLELLTDNPDSNVMPVYSLTATLFSTFAILAKAIHHFVSS